MIINYSHSLYVINEIVHTQRKNMDYDSFAKGAKVAYSAQNDL